MHCASVAWYMKVLLTGTSGPIAYACVFLPSPSPWGSFLLVVSFRLCILFFFTEQKTYPRLHFPALPRPLGMLMFVSVSVVYFRLQFFFCPKRYVTGGFRNPRTRVRHDQAPQLAHSQPPGDGATELIGFVWLMAVCVLCFSLAARCYRYCCILSLSDRSIAFQTGHQIRTSLSWNTCTTCCHYCIPHFTRLITV